MTTRHQAPSNSQTVWPRIGLAATGIGLAPATPQHHEVWAYSEESRKRVRGFSCSRRFRVIKSLYKRARVRFRSAWGS